MVDPTDEELVERLRSGDQAAGRELFERLSSSLRPQLQRRMGPALRRKVGESDLIQSAYASVAGRLAEFEDRGQGSFLRWVTGILDHKFLDELRRYGAGKRDLAREIGLDALSKSGEPRDKGRTPSRTAMVAEDRRRIRAAIDLLAPEHRAVVRLVHEQGLPLVDAARTMGRSPDAVRMLYRRAVARLTTLLRKEESSP